MVKKKVKTTGYVIAYMHILKSMDTWRQTTEMTTAYVINKEGPYYKVTVDPKQTEDSFCWTIHESNVMAKFKREHKIWRLLYR